MTMKGPEFVGMMVGALVLIFLAMAWYERQKAVLPPVVEHRVPKPTGLVRVLPGPPFVDWQREGWA